MLPSSLPRVGRGKRPRVFYNTGHRHLGWTRSAATAELVAKAVLVHTPATGRRWYSAAGRAEGDAGALTGERQPLARHMGGDI